MLSKFLRVPSRCLLSLVLALLPAAPNTALSAQAQAPGASNLNLVIVEGEGAINNIHQRTAREPIVQVEDENHKPVAGAAVIFTLPDSGPGGTFANGSKVLQVMSDSKGRAVAKGFHLNDVSGKFQIKVEASYKGASTSASINQANAVLTAAGSTLGTSGKILAVLVAAGSAAAVGVALAAKKDSGVRSPNGRPTTGGK